MGGCLNLINVPAIAMVVYRVIKIIRLATGDNEKFKRFIPLVATRPGAVCGIICHYAVPSIIPSPKWWWLSCRAARADCPQRA